MPISAPPLATASVVVAVDFKGVPKGCAIFKANFAIVRISSTFELPSSNKSPELLRATLFKSDPSGTIDLASTADLRLTATTIFLKRSIFSFVGFSPDKVFSNGISDFIAL